MGEHRIAAEDWRCPVCLELTYKPCVNSCGHIFCFWCMHRAMSGFETSKCPSCRSAYSHLPRVCESLHSFLCYTFPEEYKARGKETAEAEGETGVSSPGLHDSFSTHQNPQDMRPNTPENVFICADPKCRMLLYHPTVLNCGHMVCMDSCAYGEDGKPIKLCPVCSETAVGEPSLCYKVHEYLQHAMPSQQLAREQTTRALLQRRKQALGCGASSSSTDACLEVEENHTSDLTGLEIPDSSSAEHGMHLLRTLTTNFVHHGVGCDQCGMYPIIGERYQCIECRQNESMGFDLCAQCMAVDPQFVKGRFNQHHTPTHHMEKINSKPSIFHMLQALNPGVSLQELRRLLTMQLGLDEESLSQRQAAVTQNSRGDPALSSPLRAADRQVVDDMLNTVFDGMEDDAQSVSDDEWSELAPVSPSATLGLPLLVGNTGNVPQEPSRNVADSGGGPGPFSLAMLRGRSSGNRQSRTSSGSRDEDDQSQAQDED